MIQSMTGFGKATCELPDKVVVIELKTLNSKQLDLNLKLPSVYREKEVEIRNEIAGRLKRGKVDASFNVEYKEGKQQIRINTAIIANYYRQLKALSGELGIDSTDSLLPAILRLPEALETDREDTGDADWEKLQCTLVAAIDDLEHYRIHEGKSLAFDILNRVNLIETLLTQLEPFEKERTDMLRSKLGNSLLEFVRQENLDKDRFEQELIYYLEKMDITEEKTRLKHHCHYFAEVMKEPDQVGRKLAFVAQEIGREINTIGSKANHSGMQRIVVLMKDELEKIKEQLMNIL